MTREKQKVEQKDMDILNAWLVAAADAGTLEEFEERADIKNL